MDSEFQGLRLGQDYLIAERFNGESGLNKIKFNARYIARVEVAEGIYHCFGKITQRKYTQELKLPSSDHVVNTNYPNLVIITSLKEGSFNVEGKEITTNPENRPILVGFDDSKMVDANTEMCHRLMSRLEEAIV